MNCSLSVNDIYCISGQNPKGHCVLNSHDLEHCRRGLLFERGILCERDTISSWVTSSRVGCCWVGWGVPPKQDSAQARVMHGWAVCPHAKVFPEQVIGRLRFSKCGKLVESQDTFPQEAQTQSGARSNTVLFLPSLSSPPCKKYFNINFNSPQWQDQPPVTPCHRSIITISQNLWQKGLLAEETILQALGRQPSSSGRPIKSTISDSRGGHVLLAY